MLREENRSTRSRVENQHKLSSHMTPDPGIELGPHWWEASALTTAPSLLPLRSIWKKNNYPVVSIVNDKQFELTRKCLQSKHLYNLHLLGAFDFWLYIINIIHHGKCMRTVFTHSLVCIRNLTRSLRSLVRFPPILDQLVRKNRTHTLSMK